jgi:hypothetical protein
MTGERDILGSSGATAIKDEGLLDRAGSGFMRRSRALADLVLKKVRKSMGIRDTFGL